MPQLAVRHIRQRQPLKAILTKSAFPILGKPSPQHRPRTAVSLKSNPAERAESKKVAAAVSIPIFFSAAGGRELW